jgi:hypothetical protein
VWKEEMMQFYSSLDLRSPGAYGYRPLLEFEKTCYFKVCFFSFFTFESCIVVS